MSRNIEAKEWIKNAELTYISSRHLFLCKHPFLWFDAGYLLHQAIEKYLKTLLASKGGSARGHDIKNLAVNATKLFSDIAILDNIRRLNGFSAFRYPDEISNSKTLGESEFHLGDSIIKAIRQRIPADVCKYGIKEIATLKLNDWHLQITQILLTENNECSYWANELKGIDDKLDELLSSFSKEGRN